jgi:hypothetical protein
MGSNAISVVSDAFSCDWVLDENTKRQCLIDTSVLIDRVDREFVYCLAEKNFIKIDWRVSTLSNGGFFFYPNVSGSIPLTFHGGHYKPSEPPELAGLIVSLEAFRYFERMCCPHGKKYHRLLCDFLETLPEDNQEIVSRALF